MPFINANQDQYTSNDISRKQDDECLPESKRLKKTTLEQQGRVNEHCVSLSQSQDHSSPHKASSSEQFLMSSRTRSSSKTSSVVSNEKLHSDKNAASTERPYGPTTPPSSQPECLLDKSRRFLEKIGVKLETPDEYIARIRPVEKDKETEKRKGTRLGMGLPPMSPKSKEKLRLFEKKCKRQRKEDEFVNGPRKALYADHLSILKQRPCSPCLLSDDDE